MDRFLDDPRILVNDAMKGLIERLLRRQGRTAFGSSSEKGLCFKIRYEDHCENDPVRRHVLILTLTSVLLLSLGHYYRPPELGVLVEQYLADGL